MLVKCLCTNCAGHLEFEEENNGEKIPCPHCGFETTLYLPGSEPEELRAASVQNGASWRWRLVFGGAALLVLTTVGYVLYQWVLPWIAELLPGTAGRWTAFVALLLFCFTLPFLLIWLIFPVLLFLQLRRVIQLLSELTGHRAAVPYEAEGPADSAPPSGSEEPAVGAEETSGNAT